MISSKGVYVDGAGHHSNSAVAPHLDGPIRETQATVAPTGAADYMTREGYAANKVAAEQVLLDSGRPVTVLRPSKIHGAGLEISRTIGRHLDYVWDEVLLDDAADEELGRHPWDAPHPIVLDMTAAIDLGYEPVGDYATTVSDEVDWLVSAARGGAGAGLLPGPDDAFFAPFFVYAAEDRYLSTRPR